MDIQLGTTPLEILKWVGIVFAAGFVGYFGRYLGMLIIERLRQRKPEPPGTTEVTQETALGPDTKAERDIIKLEKKRLKLEKKRGKKAG